MLVTLRDYQQSTVNKIYNSWGSGARNVCAVLPTGAGKSVIMSEVVKNTYESRQRLVFIAHRNELVSQMACHVARRGIPHRVIASNSTVTQIIRKERQSFGESFVNMSAPVSVVGIDTLVSREDTLKEWALQQSLWIVDESHHLLRSNKWGRGVSMFKNAFGLGATATPNRADGQGLSAESDGYFNDLILGPTVRELIERGFLSDYELVCPKSDLRVDDIKLSADGDWCAKNLKKAAKESRIVGDVVENYKKYASTRKGIVFATDVETAETIARSFNESGIVAAAVSGASNPAWREQSINGFAEGRIQVLVNVDLFDEGFDISDCEIVVMARPTASLGKYLQQIGRALRPAEGKVALVIDHVSNVIRHGLPDKQRVWTLDRREKKAKQLKDPEELELTTCATCLKPYEKFRTVCPYCGNEKPLPDSKFRSIETVEGDLMLLDKAMLDKLRAETVLESPAEIAARVSLAAGSIAGKGVANRQIEKIAAQKELADAIAQWAGIQRAGGLNDREISRKFYHTTGMDVLSALSVSHNRQDYLNMAERVKGWYL